MANRRKTAVEVAKTWCESSGYTIINLDAGTFDNFTTHEELIEHLEGLVESDLVDGDVQGWLDAYVLVFKGTHRPLVVKCTRKVEVTESEK
jgi:hypothetical protein